ncbi:FAD-binding domain-containing protein [Mycena vulgaris]|nr:FAD-binding domain-containing protein [Mycena vulgaris]
MKSFTTSLVFLFCALFGHSGEAQGNSKSPACRNIPGSPGYPSVDTWNALNSTISGGWSDLPGGACTDEQWTSALFRSTIPGAMDQGYNLTPPSLCLRNATTCGQGDVPIYSVEAETVADIQAAMKFVSTYNLRLAVKTSGHDYLGRSTAPHSLLIHTVNFKNISFADSFFVGQQDMGPAVTFGSGVHAQSLYQAGKANGNIAVSGAAATVCTHLTAGGYIQGGGHSSLSPSSGLAADNALVSPIQTVSSHAFIPLAKLKYSTVFYALRGGGSGSWGVIVSATLRTFPTFNATSSLILLITLNNAASAALASVHAQHIFDLDPVRAAQYFYLYRNSTDLNEPTVLALNSYMPNTTVSQSMALLAPFLNASLAIPDLLFISQDFTGGDINDALFQADDAVGSNIVLGSRLIPAATYRDSPAKVGEVYKQLLNTGTLSILGHLVAGGQVAENAYISSAVHPAWRTAKTHVSNSRIQPTVIGIVLLNTWVQNASLEEIGALRKRFKTQQLPILENLSGPNAGAYSNEADLLETNFQTTFFGPNYAKLSAIKRKYDPRDLFIAGAGVGSKRWDEWGLCKGCELNGGSPR